MNINALIIATMVFTVIISGCTDKKTYNANESINTDENNIIGTTNITIASEQPEKTTSKDNDMSINIILEKPPKEVIGGE